MRVLVDANALFPLSTEVGPTGVGRWSAGVISGLSRLAPTWQLELVAFHVRTNTQIDESWMGPNVNLRIKRFPNRVYRMFRAANALPPIEWFLGNADAMLAPAYITWRSRSMAEIPVIHDLSFVRFPESVSRRNLRFLRFNVPRIVERAELVVTVSEAMRREIAEHFQLPEDQIVVVPNGCDPDHFDGEQRLDIEVPGLPQRYLLAVGTLEPRKNLLKVLEAYTRLRRRRSDLPELVVVGGAGWRARLLQQALEEQVATGNVHVLGYVSEHLLPILYARAEALVFPSLYEGFGLPVLEAMTSGCPVVTSDREALREVAGDAAIFVDPEDGSAIADAIEQLLDNPKLRERLILAGRARSALFSWERSGKALMEAIDLASALRKARHSM